MINPKSCRFLLTSHAQPPTLHLACTGNTLARVAVCEFVLLSKWLLKGEYVVFRPQKLSCQITIYFVVFRRQNAVHLPPRPCGEHNGTVCPSAKHHATHKRMRRVLRTSFAHTPQGMRAPAAPFKEGPSGARQSTAFLSNSNHLTNRSQNILKNIIEIKCKLIT